MTLSSTSALRRIRFLALFFLCLSFLSLPTAGSAAEFLRPGTKPLSYSMGLGPAIGIINRVSTDFQLFNTFGFHLLGSADGLAVGGDLDVSFSSGVFVLQVAPRVWWDVRLFNELGIYLSPFLRVGYNLTVLLNQPSSALGLQAGLRVKVVMADRFFAYFQPVAFDLFVANGVAMRVQIALGGGLIF